MKAARKILTVILFSAFLLSTGMTVSNLLQTHASESTYQEAEIIARLESRPLLSAGDSVAARLNLSAEEETVPPETVPAGNSPIPDDYAAELLQIDLTALKKVNPDVLGWILVPGTKVSYPLVQGEDNEYYLSHTWDHQKRISGSICMEHLCSPDFSDFNTILYGHNMTDRSMFGSLHSYEKESFREENPYVYIVTESGAYRYQIFAVHNAPVDSITYGLSIDSQARKEELIQYALEQSLYDTGIVPTPEDSILTLITCTGSGYSARWAVQAVLEGQIVPPEAEETPPPALWE